MTVDRGTVRFWLDEEGWGVIDCPKTPDGCWAHWSTLEMDGYRTLSAGQAVELTWERARQDGYDYRAVTARPIRPT